MINKRSSSYIYTVDVADPLYEAKIESVRQTVRALNASSEDGQTEGHRYGMRRRYRVSLRGRLGHNNPNALKYRKAAAQRRLNPSAGWGAGAHPYQMIRLADASRVDVYIHLRSI